jgi:SPFH domain / Band 7 family
VDWASSERPGAAELARPPAAPATDRAVDAYLSSQTVKGVSFFRFGQPKVTPKDGFQLEVDVRRVIRTLPENAAFLIARFGSVFNLIEQIVHPLIDSSFRNNAGEQQALEFVPSRSQLQQEALETARTEFAKYMVEAQHLLISPIAVDPTLLATQTGKRSRSSSRRSTSRRRSPRSGGAPCGRRPPARTCNRRSSRRCSR